MEFYEKVGLRRTSFLLAISFLSLLVVTDALPSWLQRSWFLRFNKHTFSSASEQWFEQELDHFNSQNERTWKQRYFVEDKFWKKDGPIFFEFGGEGSISQADVQSWEMSVYAEHYGALQFALEHRFYGLSQPFLDLRTSNLQFLSSQQALADAALFLQKMIEKYNAQNSSVVVFGGSYPGNLAAWFRLKYPHLTIGSVASSAPVLAVMDFYQYLDVVDMSLASVAGIECDSAISNATAYIEKLLKSEQGRKELEKTFRICQPMEGDKDITTFMSTIMAYWMTTVQYDGELGIIDIGYLCDIMLNSSENPLNQYAIINGIMLDEMEETCLDASYSNLIRLLQNVSTGGAVGIGLRQWSYQTCVEFGYFQTTDSPNQPFGNLVPLQYYVDMCKDVFGFDFLPRIQETNIFYGGKNPRGATNILFANGSLDPWHALSIIEDFSDTVTAVFINGTAHCANMIPTNSKSLPALVKAEIEIGDQIGVWLSEANKELI